MVRIILLLDMICIDIKMGRKQRQEGRQKREEKSKGE